MKYAELILVLFKYIVLCSFLSVAAQLLPLALHKHDEEFISPEPILNRLWYRQIDSSMTKRQLEFRCSSSLTL